MAHLMVLEWHESNSCQSLFALGMCNEVVFFSANSALRKQERIPILKLTGIASAFVVTKSPDACNCYLYIWIVYLIMIAIKISKKLKLRCCHQSRIWCVAHLQSTVGNARVPFSCVRDDPCRLVMLRVWPRGDRVRRAPSSASTHAGTCLGRKKLVCTCPAGYPSSDCSPSPAGAAGTCGCLHGATCVTTKREEEGLAQRCVCPAGFTGERCESRLADVCLDFPCHHGGLCYTTTSGQPLCK